eukprot:TRINITY_DN31_c0_g1_i3.p1 TRINITY_DN31_c0_g1~~TRINITY_DN31_c0_g1_i3.p1  ORF type:complete len:530 (+),score=84.81 TRINITY_DN31_c0_g1_i3:165-1754(+)
MEAESSLQGNHMDGTEANSADIPGVLVMQDTYQKTNVEPLTFTSSSSPPSSIPSVTLAQKQMMASAASAFSNGGGGSFSGSFSGSVPGANHVGDQSGALSMQQAQSAMKAAKVLTSTSSRRSIGGGKRRSVATRLSVVSSFRSSSRASQNGNGAAGGDGAGAGGAVQSPRRVSIAQRIKAAATEQVELPLVQGTSVRIFFVVAAAVMGFTIYYIVNLVVMAALEQRKDPPGQFVIEYADRLQTPVVRICPDQHGIDLTIGEQYGFPPICVTEREGDRGETIPVKCTAKKIPDIFGEDASTLCYVFNFANGTKGYPFIFEDTYASITIILYAYANIADERLVYQGVPFVLYHDDKIQGQIELPRNGYVPLNTAAMATLVLDKHIDIDGNEDWYFTSPGLTSLPLSENFVETVSGLLDVPERYKDGMGLVVMNLRFASLQVTITQEYLPLGPMVKSYICFPLFFCSPSFPLFLFLFICSSFPLFCFSFFSFASRDKIGVKFPNYIPYSLPSVRRKSSRHLVVFSLLVWVSW